MNFQEKVKFRLECYKKKQLIMTDSGTWRGVKYGHILPLEFQKDNILHSYKDAFYSGDLSNMKYHEGFAHLNSSQAMCINFFFPLIQEKKLDLVTDILELPDEEIDYAESIFEKDSHLDGIEGHRPTNFDFFIKTKSGKNIYFEIKYTESEFSKATNDEEHAKKYKRVYEQYKNKVAGATYKSKEEFFENYQILRNLIHIEQDSYVVFIYPYGNKKIRESAENAYHKIVNGRKYVEQFKILEWDELLDVLYPNLHSRKLQEHYKEFDLKYL
jgi:restriction endonuclease-like protein